MTFCPHAALKAYSFSHLLRINSFIACAFALPTGCRYLAKAGAEAVPENKMSSVLKPLKYSENLVILSNIEGSLE